MFPPVGAQMSSLTTELGDNLPPPPPPSAASLRSSACLLVLITQKRFPVLNINPLCLKQKEENSRSVAPPPPSPPSHLPWPGLIRIMADSEREKKKKTSALTAPVNSHLGDYALDHSGFIRSLLSHECHRQRAGTPGGLSGGYSGWRRRRSHTRRYLWRSMTAA